MHNGLSLTQNCFLLMIKTRSNADDEDEFSEFWNLKDEASGSGEDISNSDGINPLNGLDCSPSLPAT